MPNITKRILIERIANATGLRRDDVKQTLAAFVDVVCDELARGNRIEYRDLGVFESKLRAPRTARNPKTMRSVAVPQRRTVKFKPGLPMRQRLAQVQPSAETPSSRAPARAARKRQTIRNVEVKPAVVHI